MEEIKDYSIYLKRMSSVEDEKMFWFEQVADSVDTIIDFGASDGTLIDWIQARKKKEYHFIAVENDAQFQSMLKLKGIETIAEINQIKKGKIDWDRTAIVLSSVIHEIFSYLHYGEAMHLLVQIKSLGAKYLCIRDMVFDLCEKDSFHIADQITINQFCDQMKKSQYQKAFESYCGYWGAVGNAYQIKHFLMKYKYQENWDRELKEWYLPLSSQEYCAIFAGDGYQIDFCNVYTNSYLKQIIGEDFAIDLTYPTHIQLITKKV